MVIVHLSVNGKPAMISPDFINFAEECEIQQDDKLIEFTRVYFKQKIDTENPIEYIDIKENIKQLIKLFNNN